MADDNKTFGEIISGEKPVLVDFTATWCGPCKMMAPVLEDLKKLMQDKITILKVDVDKNPNLSNSLQIQSVPTLILFQRGNIKWRQSGVMQANQLQQVIERNIA